MHLIHSLCPHPRVPCHSLTAASHTLLPHALGLLLQLEDKSGNAAYTLRSLYEKLLRPIDHHCQQRAQGANGLLGEP